MTDGPEGEPKEQTIEFEDIEGIKIDTRCPEEDKKEIADRVKRFLQFDPEGRNMEAAELEHIFGGSSVPLTPDPFKPMAIILGKDGEEIIRKRESGREGGCFDEYNSEERNLPSYSTVVVTDEGWRWLVGRIREVYTESNLPEAPTTFRQAHDKEHFGGLKNWFKSVWPRLVATGLVFREEPHILDSSQRINFPNIIQVGIINGVDLDPSHRYEPEQHGEIVYFPSDPRQINRPTKRIVPTKSLQCWQIFDRNNYRIEYHPEWKPDVHREFKF